jgi:Lrp/AsnC family leucine-responsive transcriptional regulator
MIDKTDRKILSQLIDNCKMQSKELSRKLKIHPNTLLQRQKRLEKSGVIKGYTAVVDFSKAANRLQALMFLNVNMEKGWEEKLKPAAKLPEIVSFILITGTYDALVIARVKNEQHLATLMRKMQAIPVVTKTTTHLIVDYYKHPYEYNPLKDEFR